MKVEVQVDNGLLLIDGAAIPILTPRFERPRRWKVSAPTGREAPPMPWLVGAARASFLHASRSASEALIRVVDPAGWPAWERVRDPEDGALAPVVRWVEWSQHSAPQGAGRRCARSWTRTWISSLSARAEPHSARRRQTL